MLCATGSRVGQTFSEAKQAFDLIETRMDDTTMPLDIRGKERADASQRLIDARFAFVDHKAPCKGMFTKLMCKHLLRQIARALLKAKKWSADSARKIGVFKQLRKVLISREGDT